MLLFDLKEPAINDLDFRHIDAWITQNVNPDHFKQKNGESRGDYLSRLITDLSSMQKKGELGLNRDGRIVKLGTFTQWLSWLGCIGNPRAVKDRISALESSHSYQHVVSAKSKPFHTTAQKIRPSMHIQWSGDEKALPPTRPQNVETKQPMERPTFLSAKPLQAPSPVIGDEMTLIKERSLLAIAKEKDNAKKEGIKGQTERALNAFKQTELKAATIGTKAANLQRLAEIFKEDEEIVIPKFVAISHDIVFQFVQTNFPDFIQLWEEFKRHLSAGKDLKSAEPILQKIQIGIKEAFSKSVIFPSDDMIQPFVLLKQKIMVRSTGKEDTLKVANPGGNESIANVAPARKEISVAMGAVVASYFSMKSLGQRLAAGDDIGQAPLMPVLLQVMIGETRGCIPVSGVMYTVEAGLQTEGVVQISATYGHAEGVVTGSASSDLYYVQGDFIHGILREKITRRVPVKNGALAAQVNPPQLRPVSCLTKKQLYTLAKIGIRLQQEYGFPLDIEWTYNPKTKKYYLVQARPIPMSPPVQRSYVKPQAIKEIVDVHQITVIEPGGGKVRQLTDANVLACRTAQEALDKYIDNPKAGIEAVLLASYTAPNSHQAGFFRERGIPVIYLPGSLFNEVLAKLKRQTVLVDTQEGFIATVPSNKKAEELITLGLRRHLAPKMESECFELPNDFDQTMWQFAARLKARSKKFNSANLKLAFGWNVLDSLLNSLEEARSREERAYLLLSIIRIINKRLATKIPQYEKKPLERRILYNGFHAWKVLNDPQADEKAKKFAMNWLRTAILSEPPDGIIASETLRSALAGVKERRVLSIVSPLIERKTIEKKSIEGPYTDIFRRCEKFILNSEVRAQWKEFIGLLIPSQLQQLARLFKSLGPQVVEIWLNSTFEEIANQPVSFTKVDRANHCLKALLEVSATPHIQKAFVMYETGLGVARHMTGLVGDFGDPERFDQVFAILQKELITKICECMEMMKKAQGLEVPLLCQSFTAMVTAFDDCIKGLSDSPHYKDSRMLKLERFALLLDHYQRICCVMMGKQIVTDKNLSEQAASLVEYLPTRLEELKTDRKIGALRKDASLSIDHFSPSTFFSVALSALGSGQLDPSRAEPDRLIEFFTMVHQSLITANNSFGLRAGIKEKMLPDPVKKVMQSLSSLNLHRHGNLQTLQSIIYNYPNLTVTINVPLKNHSARFVIQGKTDSHGNLISLELQAGFFAPVNLRGIVRIPTLIILALSSYCGEDKMTAPDNFDHYMSSDKGAVQLAWKLPLGDEMETTLAKGRFYLQKMIDTLQDPYRLRQMTAIEAAAICEAFPWCIEQSSYSFHGVSQGIIFNAVLKGVIHHFDPKNILAVCVHGPHYFSSLDRDFKLLCQFVDRLLGEDILWNDPKILDAVLHFLNKLKSDSNSYYFKDVNIFNEQRLGKIRDRIKTLPESIPSTVDPDSSYKARRSEFIANFSMAVPSSTTSVQKPPALGLPAGSSSTSLAITTSTSRT